MTELYLVLQYLPQDVRFVLGMAGVYVLFLVLGKRKKEDES